MGALGLVRIANRGEVGAGVMGTGMLLGVAVFGPQKSGRLEAMGSG